jgi:hypothetical protein
MGKIADEPSQPEHCVTFAAGVRLVHIGAREQLYRPDPRAAKRQRTELEGFEYAGAAEALISLGVVSKEMLALRRPGSARFDDQGFRFEVLRSWRASDVGQPYRHYRVTRWRPLYRILELPGARVAMENYRRYQEAAAARAARIAEREAARPRPQLRLVIDNDPLRARPSPK